MLMSDIEKRSAEIREEMKVEGADIKALIEEAEGLKTRKAEIIAEQKAKKIEAEQRKAEIRAVIEGKGKEIEIREESKKMDNVEIRSSKEYADAYARYILDNTKEAEVRSLLTVDAMTGVDGATVPVPIGVEGRIRTAWDKDEIVSRISKSYFKGDLTLTYELSSTGAVSHLEGDGAPDEETLTLGTATIKPMYYKKWLGISDRVASLGNGDGERFLEYLYSEFSQKITKAIADSVLDAIGNPNPQTMVATITEAPGLTTIANALAQLSDQATNPVIIMNRATEPAFIQAMVNGNFAYDPFRNLPVLYSSWLSSYDTVQGGDAYAFVGDLSAVHGNFPDGEAIKFIVDEYSLAEQDMIKVVGKLLGGVALAQPNAFTIISKPE